MPSAASRWMAVSLLTIAAALLVVGLVSNTPIRHVIQITPVLIVTVASVRQLPSAKDAALAIFAFWLIIMVFIWLFLLGLPSPTSGKFSPSEIVLTIVIGAAGIVGIRHWRRATTTSSALIRAVAFAASFALQVFAMWLSLRPAFENR